jgi:arylformamidase
MGRLRDVTMPLFAGMPSFPGDPPFVSTGLARRDRDGPYGLSRLSFGSHAGTHLDPPSHFLPWGATVDRLDLATLNGPCRVVRVRAAGREVPARELRAVPRGTKRLLLKTSNSARWARRLEYFDDYAALGVEAAERLADLGVRLVGIDALSIEAGSSGAFPVHRILLGQGIVVLEGLLLDRVRAGRYQLHCLPLRLRGGDGAPARVVLSSP